jgi:two-component system chemotaxis response regulator CheB
MKSQIKVLVVDDSALMRKLIPQVLERDKSIHVVGTAMDGEFAIKKIAELKPDVVTLDLEMPRMDGMETLRQIMKRFQVPVIVVSAHSTEGASATFKALGLGAFDFVAKPRDVLVAQMDDIALDLIGKIKAAVNRSGGPRPLETPTVFGKVKKAAIRRPLANRVVAIGISTGGPNSLQLVLSRLPADFPGAIAIVQHMPEGFTELFARRLDECCAIDVKEAASGDLLLAGRALICPGNRHMRVHKLPAGNVISLTDEPRVNGHRPSADILFQSVAQEFGYDALGIIMTGMGEDGAAGLATMKAAGAFTIAQDEQSSVVFGMPRAAIERGAASRVVSLDAMAGAIQNTAADWPRPATRV